MSRYILKRLITSLPTLLGIVTLVFLLMHLLPGDPASIMLGFAATEERVASLRQELGLDDPLHTQYVRYLQGLAQGDWGRSMSARVPVTQLIRERIPATAELAFAGLLVASLFGIVTGVVSAVNRGTWLDTMGMVVSLVGVSMPSFWLGLLLILLLSVTLGLLPITGTGGIQRLIMPALALGVQVAGVVSRLARSSMLEVLREDYIQVARAKGLRERVVIYKHALKNAMIPVLTVLGLQFGRLLGGTVIIETVFGREGIGRMLVDAIMAQDVPLVQGTVLVSAFFYVMVNILVDICYGLFDPRVTYS